MKKILLTSMFVLYASILLQAQTKPSPPAETSATINGTQVTINYSQPAVKGRTIWGDLVPFDAVWRTGANEATWIEISDDVEIEGQPLKAGKYGLFTIPGREEWTVIFNRTWEQWGAYEYDESKDALRVSVVPTATADKSERMTFNIDENGKVDLLWDKLKVSFTIY